MHDSFLINSVQQGDCLEGIRRIPDNSVKAIIADPPYHQGLSHDGKKVKFADLNIVRPFFENLFAEFKRVLRDDGEVFWFTDWRGIAFYYPIFDEVLGARNLITWDKGAGPGSHYGYNCEFILFSSIKGRLNRGGSNCWRIPGFTSATARKAEPDRYHPTQKPQTLIGRILTDATEEGDLVVDPFSGSGTVALVAAKLNRNFIAFEFQEKYWRQSLKRFKKEMPHRKFLLAA